MREARDDRMTLSLTVLLTENNYYTRISYAAKRLQENGASDLRVH